MILFIEMLSSKSLATNIRYSKRDTILKPLFLSPTIRIPSIRKTRHSRKPKLKMFSNPSRPASQKKFRGSPVFNTKQFIPGETSKFTINLSKRIPTDELLGRSLNQSAKLRLEGGRTARVKSLRRAVQAESEESKVSFWSYKISFQTKNKRNE